MSVQRKKLNKFQLTVVWILTGINLNFGASLPALLLIFEPFLKLWRIYVSNHRCTACFVSCCEYQMETSSTPPLSPVSSVQIPGHLSSHCRSRWQDWIHHRVPGGRRFFLLVQAQKKIIWEIKREEIYRNGLYLLSNCLSWRDWARRSWCRPWHLGTLQTSKTK